MKRQFLTNHNLSNSIAKLYNPLTNIKKNVNPIPTHKSPAYIF